METVFADEGLPFVYVMYRKALRGSICEKCENVQCALYHMAVTLNVYISSVYAAIVITRRQGSQVDSNL